MVCIDLKFGSNEFHNRIADEKKTIWKMFLNYILVPYIEKNFSDYNCYQLNIHLRQSFKYSGAILLCIVYNIKSFKIEIRVACRILLYSVIWTDRESYRRTITLVKSMITLVSLRELHAVYTSTKY